MEKLEFHKYCGHGSDFVIIDNWEGQLADKALAKITKMICREKFGVGAEGVIFIVAGPDEVDFACRFFSPDGSELDFSGTGAVCAAHLANVLGISPDEMSFKTKAGTAEAKVEGAVVRLKAPKISRPEGAALLEAEGQSLTYHRLNLGGPHVVAWVEELESLNVPKVGRAARRHPAFAPDGATVDFVKVTGEKSLSLRTYEKGIEAEVLASADGAMAAAMLATAQNLIAACEITCQTKGGDFIVRYQGASEAPTELEVEAQVRYLFSAQAGPDLFTAVK